MSDTDSNEKASQSVAEIRPAAPIHVSSVGTNAHSNIENSNTDKSAISEEERAVMEAEKFFDILVEPLPSISEARKSINRKAINEYNKLRDDHKRQNTSLKQQAKDIHKLSRKMIKKTRKAEHTLAKKLDWYADVMKALPAFLVKHAKASIGKILQGPTEYYTTTMSARNPLEATIAPPEERGDHNSAVQSSTNRESGHSADLASPSHEQSALNAASAGSSGIQREHSASSKSLAPEMAPNISTIIEQNPGAEFIVGRGRDSSQMTLSLSNAPKQPLCSLAPTEREWLLKNRCGFGSTVTISQSGGKFIAKNKALEQKMTQSQSDSIKHGGR
ncbi:MAG: hypothetical protein V4568_14945 [Pseudomonadota bacterium]